LYFPLRKIFIFPAKHSNMETLRNIRPSTEKGNAAFSLRSLIGNTPMAQLRRILPKNAPQVFLKLEQFNPGGSIKDRTALGMLVRAEELGVLKPGMTIIESSSGNTAIGLAMLGREKGYNVVAICDRHLPETKRIRLRSFGADIVYLPETPKGMDTVELRIGIADHLASIIPNSISPGQYSNPGNPAIHYSSTGPEIWNDMDGDITALFSAVGTCGTISGVGKYLKEQDANIKIYGVEPEGSIVFGGKKGNYLVQGGGLSFIPGVLDKSVIDCGVKVPDAATFGAIRELALHEGWMVGGTGGMVMAAILSSLDNFSATDRIVGIIPDGGERYLETAFSDAWYRENGFGASIYDGISGGRSLTEGVDGIGCSLNTIPGAKGPSIEELCKIINIEFSMD
jgi:cysteine synthase